MRHRKSGKAFSRTSSHRRAMIHNMCSSLIEHEQIKTTLPKAKELRRFIEPLVTVSKTDSVALRRNVFAKLRSQAAVAKLFTILGPRFAKRPGGYVRVLKCGFRVGDNAPMAIIEFVEKTPKEIEKAEEKTDKAEKSVKTKKPVESEKSE